MPEPVQLNRYNPLLLGILISVGLWIFLGTSIDGVDAEHYRAWENCYETGKLPSGNQKTTTASGFVFFQWNPFVACMALWSRYLGFEDCLLVTSLLLKCLFLFNCVMAFKRLFPQNGELGMLLLLISSQVVYYLRTTGAELVALTCVGVLFFQIAKLIRRENISWVVTCSCGFLLLVSKSYLAIYALPVISLSLWDSRNQSGARLIAYLGVGVLFLATALFLNGYHNWLMTGEFSRSPYSFGDGQFSSLDLSAPAHFKNILFDAYHGLLSTSPLTVIGLFAMIVLTIQAGLAKTFRLFTVWLATLTAVSVNIWINSCWYYWSMAELSFGMRGLVLTGVPSTVAIMTIFVRAKRANKTLISIMLIVCSTWTFAQLTQGPTSYYYWHALIHGQMLELMYHFNRLRFLLLAAGIVFVAAMLNANIRKQWKRVSLEGILAVYFSILLFLYIIDNFQFKMMVEPGISIVMGLIFVCSALLLCNYLNNQLELKQVESYCWRLNWLAPMFVFSTILFASFLFKQLEFESPVGKRIKRFQEKDLLTMISSFKASPRNDLNQSAEKALGFYRRQVGHIEVVAVSSGLHSHQQIAFARKSRLRKY